MHSLKLMRDVYSTMYRSHTVACSQLNSALGRYDGDVYTALMASAKRGPMNATEPVKGWEGDLKQMIAGSRYTAAKL
jgi:Acyl-CoA oxidase